MALSQEEIKKKIYLKIREIRQKDNKGVKKLKKKKKTIWQDNKNTL